MTILGPLARLRRSLALVLGFTLPAVAGAANALQAPQGKDDEDIWHRRELYFLEQRQYPFGQIPEGAAASVAAARARHMGLRPFAAQALTWQFMGWDHVLPGIFGAGRYAGWINDLAVDPANRQRLYAATPVGGLWKTDDNGGHWQPLTDRECILTTSSVAVDPVNPSIIYLGTGHFPYIYGCGLLRSTDGGATWARMSPSTWLQPDGTEPSVMIRDIAILPQTAGTSASTTVLAATTNGLFRSTNSGATWTAVLTIGWYYLINDVVVDANSPTTLYAAAYDYFGQGRTGIFRSTDGGVTWTQLLNGLPTWAETRDARVAVSRSAPTLVYAGICTNTAGCYSASWQVYSSGDGGTSWTLRGTAPELFYLAVDPHDPARVFTGGVHLRRSVDGARTFADITGFMHLDQRAIAFDPVTPGVVYSGSDGGVYRSADGGNSWTDLNSDLAIAMFYPGITPDPQTAGGILGGTQDNGIDYRGSDGTWRLLGTGDGGYTAIDPGPPRIEYAEVQWIPNSGYSGPLRRPTGQPYFSRAVNGINGGERAAFIPPLVMDPSRHQTLYFGTYHIYRSTDGALSWTVISGDLTKGSNPYVGFLSSIAPAPSDPLTVYAATFDGNFHRSTDGGATWTLRVQGLPNRSLTDIAVSSANPQLVYAVFSGFQAGHVFRSQDGGTTWEDISGDLGDVPVNAVAYVPGADILFIGTDVGAFSSTGAGGVWSVPADGLPPTLTEELVYDPTAQLLYAATQGRGIYAIQLSLSALRGDVNLDGQVSAADAQGILTSAVGLPLPRGWVRLPNGDATCDGAVTALDAQVVLAYAVGSSTAPYCVGSVR